MQSHSIQLTFLSFLLIVKHFPEFEGAAAELKGWGIPLIKVDGTKERELADQVSIKNFIP